MRRRSAAAHASPSKSATAHRSVLLRMVVRLVVRLVRLLVLVLVLVGRQLCQLRVRRHGSARRRCALGIAADAGEESRGAMSTVVEWVEAVGETKRCESCGGTRTTHALDCVCAGQAQRLRERHNLSSCDCEERAESEGGRCVSSGRNSSSGSSGSNGSNGSNGGMHGCVRDGVCASRLLAYGCQPP